ncbi:MAG TPA: hypothetical protein VLR89_04520 [Anaerolineaceae bacterium]|nr:hypothetical protein [Anaerolineaceae bacterium]
MTRQTTTLRTAGTNQDAVLVKPTYIGGKMDSLSVERPRPFFEKLSTKIA